MFCIQDNNNSDLRWSQFKWATCEHMKPSYSLTDLNMLHTQHQDVHEIKSKYSIRQFDHQWALLPFPDRNHPFWVLRRQTGVHRSDRRCSSSYFSYSSFCHVKVSSSNTSQCAYTIHQWRALHIYSSNQWKNWTEQKCYHANVSNFC